MKNVTLPSSQIIFFCETWCLSPAPKIPGKDFFFSPAVATTGRPSGGLEFYLDPSLKPSLISKTALHLCVSVNNTIAIIGVYYKPTLELDDILIDLTVVLDICRNSNLSIILGGDFNLHLNTAKFSELLDLLSSYDISLTSDPSFPSFVGNNGSSTPDHIFSSHALNCLSTTVSRPESPHFPLSFIVDLPDNPPAAPPNSDLVFELDYEKCNHDLKLNAPSQLPTKNPSVLTLELNKILSNCLSTKQRRPPSPPWHSNTLVSLKRNSKRSLEFFLRSPSPLNRQKYMASRKAVSIEIKRNTTKFYENKLSSAILNAQEQGIKSLYKSAKKPSTDLSSSVPLNDWKEFCADLYQSYPAPSVPDCPSVPTEKGSAVLSPVSQLEIFNVINRQKSKAKDQMGISPIDLKAIARPLSAWLTPIFNAILEGTLHIPDPWLNSTFFFLFKKGSPHDPTNYRSLAIESPILKILTSLLTNRLTVFAESSNILPNFQFGFRKGHSTTSAALLLQHCVKSALDRKEKVFACFVDFKKAFDLVDRSLLYSKLLHIGLPRSFCTLLHSILSGLKFSVRSNGSLSSPFYTYNGVPQGDPLSPILFSLFIYDLPDSLNSGIPLIPDSSQLKYLLYADDLIVLGESHADLQIGMAFLQRYCSVNNLTVSIPKTKVLIFYRGSRPAHTHVHYQGTVLETVNAFVYLGITFTTRLSSSKHIDRIVAKCHSRIAFLFSRLPIADIPLSTALEVFNVFILSVIRYALSVWFPAATISSLKRIDAVFTKFLKRFLGLPYSALNSLTYKITNTVPLSSTLALINPSSFLKLTFPLCMDGILLPAPLQLPQTNSPPLPTYFDNFPASLPVLLPILKAPKRALLYPIFDLYHPHICSSEGCSHLPSNPDSPCFCRFCSLPIDHFHTYSCPSLSQLSPCALMKYLHNEEM